MKTFRKVIFWGHLCAGLFAGVVVLIMSVTGVLLTYEKQMIAWADARAYSIAPPANATRLPIEQLVNQARRVKTESPPTGVTLRSKNAAPIEVNFGREGALFVNPYTGQVMGEGSKSWRSFFRFVTDVHRWLGAQGNSRPVGRAITGACNLAFLFLVVSGLYLWLPRVWTSKAVRQVLWFRRGLSGKARDFNWHNVIGFWTLVPLFVIVLSGVVISYTWAGNLVYRVAGEAPPSQQGPPQQGPPRPNISGAERGQASPPAAAQGGENARRSPEPERRANQISTDNLESLLARVERHTSGWRSISLQFPATPDAPVTFTIDQGTGGEPQKRAQLTLDRVSGETVRYEPFSKLSPGRKLRSVLRFAHTGEVGGLIGQTIAGIASAAGAVLVWTGFALAWRRFRAWKSRQSRNFAGQPLDQFDQIQGATRTTKI